MTIYCSTLFPNSNRKPDNYKLTESQMNFWLQNSQPNNGFKSPAQSDSLIMAWKF